MQTKKSTIRVEHSIGLSAQVDWKGKLTMMDQNGVPHTFSIFLYVLPYSKFKFLKLMLDQKQDTLFKCLFRLSELQEESLKKSGLIIFQLSLIIN